MSALSYTPRTWRERLGTNLNKFLKTSETTSSVILENAPDAITQAGTPFTADAMNNIENGIENNYWFEERALGQTARSWTGMAAAPNGDVYAYIKNGGDIYKQSGGTGDFVALGQTTRDWRGMSAAPNGDVYACVYGGDIYKRSGGTGDFVALGQTTRDWTGMAAAPNGDIYASVYNGDIYKQSGGTGNFIALGQTARYWVGMAAAPNGDVYACTDNSDIYKQSGGTGDFVALGQISRYWYGMAAAPNGDVYACVRINGDIYKQSGGTGDFVALGQTTRDWYGMAAAPNGDVYACVYGGDIYTFNYAPITPASIFPVTVTNADVTVTENRFQTIRFSGALTGNRVVTMPSDVRQYKLICDCTGSYYIQVKTASGTGVYLAPGDASDVYCDGTNIVMEKLTRSSRLVGTSLGSALSVTANAVTPITGLTVHRDQLNEFNASTGVFTAKNSGWYRLTGYVFFAGTGLANWFYIKIIRASDSNYAEDDLYSLSNTTVILNPSAKLYLAAGDSMTISVYAQTGTGITLTTGSVIRVIPE